MERLFNKEDAAVIRQLSSLYCLRPKLESRQQYLLIRSVLLTRFIRIAALRHLRNQPEITLARKLLIRMLPDFQPLNSAGNLLSILKETAPGMGNRMN
jgi:hypothetical protein